MGEAKSHFVRVNQIRMHVTEQGEGPLVVLCHGFPECGYSWRHQLPALAAAGFRAVAPDQRGYGRTDRPDPIEAYDILQLTGDIVGLVNALGVERAFVVGHDWGAPVAWHCALLRPDLFEAVALLSVPYLPHMGLEIRPTEAMRLLGGETQQFYQYYFQEPGKAERELEADVRRTLTMFLYSLSGDAPPEHRWRYVFGNDQGLLDGCSMPERLPPWLTEADLAHFTAQFQHSGFRGGLNWYRNIDRLPQVTPFLVGAKIRQPSLFVAGELDGVLTMYADAIANLEQNMPNLRKKAVFPGAGHWIQQERPAEVNALLVEFLREVTGTKP